MREREGAARGGQSAGGSIIEVIKLYNRAALLYSEYGEYGGERKGGEGRGGEGGEGAEGGEGKGCRAGV